MKIATFNINNVNKRLANLLAWLRAAKPDVVCLQELKATDREFPKAAIEQGRLRRRLARAEIVEWRRHSGAWRRADRDAHRTSRRSGRPAGALHRSRRQWRAHYLALCAERQSAAGSEIRIQARLDGPARGARGRALCRRTFRSSSPATSTSCRPIAISIQRTPTPKTRFLRRKLAPGLRAFSISGWRDAVRSVHPDAADVHLLELFAEPLAARCRVAHRPSAVEQRSRRSFWSRLASIARCAAKITRVIMRRPGSSCARWPRRAFADLIASERGAKAKTISLFAQPVESTPRAVAGD